MRTITLTTDFGTKDHWISVVKSRLFTLLDNIRIIDISHEITPHNVFEAAYIINASYPYFNPGTIHIIGINPLPTVESNVLIFKFQDQYFITGDNGILGLITQEIPAKQIISIYSKHIAPSSFMILDTFTNLAVDICCGKSIESLGRKTQEFKQLVSDKPYVNQAKNEITGSIIYVDRYGNLITNISRELFFTIVGRKKFQIRARGFIINQIHDNYSDYATKNKRYEDPSGGKLAIFNSQNFLEIAIYRSNPSTVGSASTLFGIKLQDKITITY